MMHDSVVGLLRNCRSSWFYYHECPFGIYFFFIGFHWLQLWSHLVHNFQFRILNLSVVYSSFSELSFLFIHSLLLFMCLCYSSSCVRVLDTGTCMFNFFYICAIFRRSCTHIYVQKCATYRWFNKNEEPEQHCVVLPEFSSWEYGLYLFD